MTRRLVYAAAIFAASAALSGCYTVLQAPRSQASDFQGDESRYASTRADERATSPRIGDFRDDGEARDPFAPSPYGYGNGFPIFGYDSRGGLYGFGSPFAYGAGYGAGYGGYGAAAGPYGYGYDPYYSGAGGGYIPPGYELVTTQELDQLRAENAALRSASVTDVVPTVNRSKLAEQERRAWGQRTPAYTRPATTRKSTAGVRTPKRGSSVSGGSSKPAASKGSGGSTAKRRKTRR